MSVTRLKCARMIIEESWRRFQRNGGLKKVFTEMVKFGGILIFGLVLLAGPAKFSAWLVGWDGTNYHTTVGDVFVFALPIYLLEWLGFSFWLKVEKRWRNENGK